MTGRIENLYAALSGKQVSDAEKQKTWSWIKANDPVLMQMLIDAKQYTKFGEPMIRAVTVKMK